MKVSRILSAAAALLMAVAALAPSAVFAEEEEEKEIIEFKYDKDMLSELKEPAISFDTSDYKDYIHLSRDAAKAKIGISEDKDTPYQGVSLRVSADTQGIDGYFSCSGFVSDADNNPVYPDAPEETEVDKMNLVGLELHSEDFGLSTFDGCLFNFAYRLSEEDAGALMADTVWVFPADSDDVRTGEPLKLTVNTTIDDNVNQYRNNALVSIPEESNSTKLIIDIPTLGAVTGDVLFLDNILIELPDYADVGDAKYIMNLDGYNKNAQVSEIVDEIKISKGKNDTTIADKKIEKVKDNTKKRIIILVVVVGVLVLGVGGVAFVKLKKRFY